MSALNIDRLDAAIGRDQGLYLDRTLKGHAASQCWIDRGRLTNEPALASFLRLRMNRNDKEEGGKKQRSNYAMPQQGFHLT